MKQAQCLKQKLFFQIPTAGSSIDCFECNSWEDARCHDPFNFSIYDFEMPKKRPCDGCCVKMVQFIGTGKKNLDNTYIFEFLSKVQESISIV